MSNYSKSEINSKDYYSRISLVRNFRSLSYEEADCPISRLLDEGLKLPKESPLQADLRLLLERFGAFSWVITPSSLETMTPKDFVNIHKKLRKERGIMLISWSLKKDNLFTANRATFKSFGYSIREYESTDGLDSTLVIKFIDVLN